MWSDSKGVIMAILVVGYDIHPSKGEEYTELLKVLNSYGGNSWHCLDSTWMINTNETTIQLRDKLWNHMKSDDQLLVLRYGDLNPPKWAHAGFNDQCAKWIKDNL
jgi:hypothetical protein